jgi:hypothetical protein
MQQTKKQTGLRSGVDFDPFMSPQFLRFINIIHVKSYYYEADMILELCLREKVSPNVLERENYQKCQAVQCAGST